MSIKEQFNKEFAEEWEQPFSTVEFGDEGEKNLAEFLYDGREDFQEKTQRPLFRAICHQLKECKVKFILYYLEKFDDGYHYIPIYIPSLDTCIGFDHRIIFQMIGTTPDKEILYKTRHKNAIIFEGSEKNVNIEELLKL